MYKCAIIGVSGGRAAGLAAAYAHVKKGRQAAVATPPEENLHAAIQTIARCWPAKSPI